MRKRFTTETSSSQPRGTDVALSDLAERLRIRATSPGSRRHGRDSSQRFKFYHEKIQSAKLNSTSSRII